MKRIIRVALALAMAAMVAVPAAASGAVSPSTLPPPPADGQRVRLEQGSFFVYEWPAGSGTWYLDSSVGNFSGNDFSPAVTVVSPMASVEYFAADGSTSQGVETFRVPARVMPASPTQRYYSFFHHRLTKRTPATDLSRTRPAAPDSSPTTPLRFWGTAASSAVFAALSDDGGTPPTPTLDGGVAFDFTVTNNGSEIVGPVIPVGNEDYGVTSSVANMLDTYESVPIDAANAVKAQRLAPGESVVFHMSGHAKTPAGMNRFSNWNLWAEGEPLDDATVWRFYNRRTGTHFYTADPAEMANVLATLAATYQLDGVSYVVRERYPVNDTPLYRFYNRKTGTHFYTADAVERDRVATTMSATYQLDGISYYVSDTASGPQVWRFYNKKTGTHFYTADPAEKTTVQNTMGATYQLDGPAFYLGSADS